MKNQKFHARGRNTGFSRLLMSVVILWGVGCSMENTGDSDGYGTDTGEAFCDNSRCLPDFCLDSFEFNDSFLEEVIRKTVNIPHGRLQPEDFLEIVELDTSVDRLRGDPGVTDLQGIECLVRLERLLMKNNNIIDLSPLANLGNLRELSLVSTLVTDLEPLSSIGSLEVLDLSSVPADLAPRNLEPLESISSLRELDIAYGGVEDLSSISRLEGLVALHAFANEIEDISPISALTELRSLDLSANDVADLSPLTSLVHLQYLNLGFNNIEDIRPLVENSGFDEGDILELTENPLDCHNEVQAGFLEVLVDRGVILSVDCLPCVDDSNSLACRCSADPSIEECHCYLAPLECLCDEEPEHEDCFCYFYPGDPSCTE